MHAKATLEDPLPDTLVRFIERHPRLFVLTGAGCSTESGIPDYRDGNGDWKHRQPVQYRDFVGSEHVRRRYWARSVLGWSRFAQARPNAAHAALAQLETAGRVHQLVTQNVDGLHQRAGSRRVIDLHGRLDTVACLACRQSLLRADWQQALLELNPELLALAARAAPDGDAEPDGYDYERFRIPACPHCGGVLKPAVVFFGESVPKPRIERCYRRLAEADALLVVGSSLMVYSGYRFCRAACEQSKPVAAINLGRTRADAELSLKITEPCGRALSWVLEQMGL
jgi:NAD-dependent SIR2 family protein deacetylase